MRGRHGPLRGCTSPQGLIKDRAVAQIHEGATHRAYCSKAAFAMHTKCMAWSGSYQWGENSPERTFSLDTLDTDAQGKGE